MGHEVHIIEGKDGTLSSFHWPGKQVSDKSAEIQILFTFESSLNKVFHGSLQAEIPNRPGSSTQVTS